MKGGVCECSSDEECSYLNQAPICDFPSTCQGSRIEGICVAGSCEETLADNDSACYSGLEADSCGLYPSVYCNGLEDQAPPMCPSTCIVDGDCDPIAHCKAGICQPDLLNGEPCTKDAECSSNNCSSGICS